MKFTISEVSTILIYAQTAVNGRIVLLIFLLYGSVQGDNHMYWLVFSCSICYHCEVLLQRITILGNILILILPHLAIPTGVLIFGSHISGPSGSTVHGGKMYELQTFSPSSLWQYDMLLKINECVKMSLCFKLMAHSYHILIRGCMKF